MSPKHCGSKRPEGAKPWVRACELAPEDARACLCSCEACDRISVATGMRAPTFGRTYAGGEERFFKGAAPELAPELAPAPELGEQLRFPW